MIGLDSRQRQLLFDYCMGLTSGAESNEAKTLVASNQEATDLHSQLKAAFKPLDSLETQPCPDELVERTLRRLRALADSSRSRSDQPPDSQHMPAITFGRLPWATFAGRFATAAVFLLAAGILLPALGHARYHSRLQRCKMQQSSFFDGLRKYVSDHDDKEPAVAAEATE